MSKKYRVNYIDGQDHLFKTFETTAESTANALRKLYDTYDADFNHQILCIKMLADNDVIEMTYDEMTQKFCEAERAGYHLTGYIVFSEDSFGELYPVQSRTYEVSSDNKAFQTNMGGYSIFGSAIDGSDPMVRLEGYMRVEKGGANGWKIERCYMKKEEKES